jgi:hypothetical protein
VRTLSETSNDHALCCMLNHANTLVQLLHCLSLSSCQLKSTPPAAQLLLSQSEYGYLVVLGRISLPSCEPLYATNTSHRKQDTFFRNILRIYSFRLKETHKRTLLFRTAPLKHGLHLNTRSKTTSKHAHARLLPRLS